MRRIVEVCVLWALALAGMSVHAMPLGVRTLLHGHAVARQLAEEEPIPQIWTVTFDANGGVLIGEDESGGLGAGHPTSVTNGCAIGELPIAIRTDYMFEGWFTAGDGGEQVTAETVINSAMTLCAHWRCRFAFGDGDDWAQLPDGSWESGATADGATNSLSMTVNGAGVVSFRWKTSCEDYFNFKGMLLRQDGLSFIVDGEEIAFANGVMSGWTKSSFSIEGTGSHTLTWCYIKDVSGSDGEDCAWLDAVTWTPDESAAEGIVVEVNGAAVAFETAEDGKTRTAAVEAGTKAEDVKVVVGGVDVTAGFRVAVEGTTATVALMEPFEVRGESAAAGRSPYQDNGDGNVTLNVEVVPGLYYAADSAATLGALKCPGSAAPAKAGDAVVAPKRDGSQGFYKVWVSDAPIVAE